MENAEKALVEYCRELAQVMNTQNNRSTSSPLFVVQEYLPSRFDDDGQTIEEEWQFNMQAGVFLTSGACDRHIDAKRYRYAKKVRSYGISAYNSYETATLFRLISQIGEKPDTNSYPSNS